MHWLATAFAMASSSSSAKPVANAAPAAGARRCIAPWSVILLLKILPLLTDPAAHGGDPQDAFTVMLKDLFLYRGDESRPMTFIPNGIKLTDYQIKTGRISLYIDYAKVVFTQPWTITWDVPEK